MMVSESSIPSSIWEWQPRIAVVAGSGFAVAIPPDAIRQRFPMDTLPGLPMPGAAGHSSELCIVMVQDIPVLIALGRTHLYEGYRPTEVCAFVRTAVKNGCHHVLLTNAAGGIHPRLEVGDLVLADDLMDCTNQNDETATSTRSANLIDSAWSKNIAQHAGEQSLRMHTGTYVSVLGPSYETQAEIGMYRRMGADTIGMSTVHEARCAVGLGASVAVISLVTNVLSEVRALPLHHDHVIEAGHRGASTIWTSIKSAILTA